MNAKAANWTNIILGVWLFFSPWIFNANAFALEATANWNFWISGLLIAGVGSLALNRLEAWEEWTNLFLGVWVMISPWALGFSPLSAYMWNALIVGGIVTVSAMLALNVVNRKAMGLRA